ncbi:D-glycerate dehydrogenase [Patescibacteria group bacterium]|jgi:glyoxylate reductase|nr:D-glycerate dehydrogenase [Patescibacteria group bacterium]
MKVLITRPIPDEGIELLRKKNYQIDLYEKDEVMPRKELLKRAKGMDGILSLLNDKVDAELLDAAGPQLKIVANYAVGFDNVDLPAAKKRNVIVTNTPAPEVSETVAEHTFALLMALAHRVVESDGYARAKKYKGWGPNLLLGTDVYGKTLGLIGGGRIGAAVADRAVKGFKMKCVYSDIKRNGDFERAYGAKFLPMEKLLQVSDFVSLHVPLLPSTRHLISTAEFSLMKKTAFLINTARGPVVDEKALLRALKTKRIAGAALDVFECEPEIDCDLTDKLELKSFPNVVLTPHTASATIEARQAMSRFAAENLIAVLSGKAALTPAK